MATNSEVLRFLCPNSEWVIYDNDFDKIEWVKGDSITKAEFEAGFAKVDAWKAKEEAAAVAAKEAVQAKLAALGLTADDLKALGL